MIALFGAGGCAGGCGGGGGNGGGVQNWAGFAGDAQHSAVSPVASSDLVRIRWSSPVDLHPAPGGGGLQLHYGSPTITAGNTVVFPVKTGVSGEYRFDAISGSSGETIWSATTDYVLPTHHWLPGISGAVTTGNRFYYPGAGGTLYYRDKPDTPAAPAGSTGQMAFFGIDLYRAADNAAKFNSAVFINTPLTADRAGNLYFGVQATADNPAGVTSCVVKLAADGTFTRTVVAAIAPGMAKVAHNSAPAVSPDGAVMYILLNSGNGTGMGSGYLAALRTSDLSVIGRARLLDPKSGSDALVSDDATASPTVGPDGDVYIGILEAPFASRQARGWLLHFDSALTEVKTPGPFGWDTTASIVPASMVPAYNGPSAYLLATKFNDYTEYGGDGVNRLVIVDPNATETDSLAGRPVMKIVQAIVGPTPDLEKRPAHPDAVKEWCVNSLAVDPRNRAIIANCEDGRVYRWDLASNTFSQALSLSVIVGAAYSPTLIGPDGTVYAINSSALFAVGR